MSAFNKWAAKPTSVDRPDSAPERFPQPNEPSVVRGLDPVDPLVRRESVAADCCTCHGAGVNLADIERGVCDDTDQ
jgi:hypothetical protein